MGTPPPPRADHSNAWSRFLWRNSSWCPAWTSPGAALGHLLLPCCWLSGRRGWLPPGHTLLPGTSREGDKVPLSLLQAEHPRLPQPLPVGLVRQTFFPSWAALPWTAPALSPCPRTPGVPACRPLGSVPWMAQAAQGAAPMCPWGCPQVVHPQVVHTGHPSLFLLFSGATAVLLSIPLPVLPSSTWQILNLLSKCSWI